MLTLDFALSPWLVIPSVLLAGGISFWLYQKEKNLSPWVKYFLIILRTIAVFLLLLLLLEPLMTFISEEKTPPSVAILLDDSESMLAQGDTNLLFRVYPQELQKLITDLKSAGAKPEIIAFGKDNRKILSVDSLTYREPETNLSAAIENLNDFFANQHLAAAVLVSDGISTAGKNPIYSTEHSTIPIFTAILGDTNDRKDVLIESVLCNEISFIKTETPVRVTIKSSGFSSGETYLTLLHKGKTLQKQAVSLTNPISNFQFSIPLTEPGIQQFTIEIANQPGEI
ncbi:MAG: VWA domain-containing protein, partial [Bacteroidia bacterium]|nr:VWA domain-containing protein [Bacteroidia bacterium]